MHLFLTGNSHFVECLLILGFNKFLPNGIRPRTTISVTPSQEGVAKIVVTPIFFSIHAGFGLFKVDFSKSPHRDVQPQRAKQKKTAFLLLLRKAFFHFLDTGREMIFDCPSGLSWGLTGEGGNSFLPAAGTEETIKQPSFSSMETDIFPNLSGGEVQQEEQFFLTRRSCENTAQPLPPED